MTPETPANAAEERTAEQLAAALVHAIQPLSSVAVAFSGGVDSAVVMAAAYDALGQKALAVTAETPALPEGELDQATDLARQLGIRHVVVQTREFHNPSYTANPSNRCFYCKDELYRRLAERLPEWNVAWMLNGTNRDDLADWRPGLQAAAQHGVRSPLVEAGLGKQDVRRLAKFWNLPIWDKPAAPCLASRIAYGVAVTPERVRRIDAAESWLRLALPCRELRVRLEADELARIEVPLEQLATLCEPARRLALVNEFKRLGFRAVTLDLEGFRSGSLNALVELHALAGGRS